MDDKIIVGNLKNVMDYKTSSNLNNKQRKQHGDTHLQRADLENFDSSNNRADCQYIIDYPHSIGEPINYHKHAANNKRSNIQ